MKLQDQIKAYKKDGSFKKELIVRKQKACSYIAGLITDNPGGWAAVKDNPEIEEARNLIILMSGELNFQQFVVTVGIDKSLEL